MKRRICDLRPLFEEQRAFVLDECLTCCGVVAEPWWQICRLVSKFVPFIHCGSLERPYQENTVGGDPYWAPELNKSVCNILVS